MQCVNFTHFNLLSQVKFALIKKIAQSFEIDMMILFWVRHVIFST